MLYTNCYVTLNLKPLRNLISCKKENTLCQALSYNSLYTRELKVMVLYQPFQNRTIPPTFRRASVCVCLYGFASVQNLGHTRLRHPCLACPSRCTQPFHPHNHCKRTIIHRSALNLPPLSKGGGLTARHKLLLCCVLLAICPLFLYCKLFCRQDGGIASVASTLSIPTTLENRQHPCL